MPLWGGVAIYLSMAMGLLAAVQRPQIAGHPLSKLAMALIPAAGLACLFGTLDDLWAFRSRRKLVLQFFSVLPVVLAGYSIDRIVVFGCPIALGWFGVPLTILWLLGCINALNLIDGMDGLASIVGLSTAAMMSIIAMSMGNAHVAVIAVVLAGSIGGFLVYNFPPASIFLGDSGSAVIGLALGILGIQGAMKTSATLSITAPAVIMTLPMFDVVMAVVRRTLTGRRFDAADRQHIHHQLLDRGLSPWQVLCIVGALLPDHRRRGHGRHGVSLGRPGVDRSLDADRAGDPLAAVWPPRVRPAQGRGRPLGDGGRRAWRGNGARKPTSSRRTAASSNSPPPKTAARRLEPRKKTMDRRPVKNNLDLDVGVIYTREQELMGPLLTSLAPRPTAWPCD